MNIFCERCGEKFKKVKIITRIIDKQEDVRKEYIACPKCKKEYTILYRNRVIDDLIKAGEKESARMLSQALRAQYEHE